ncbi:MAG: LysM peptidoglycan-binding domain-containing protein, partial [Coprobacillus sp.]
KMYNPYMYENERVTYPKVGEIIVYTVNKGDNVYRIAKTFQSEVSWIQVMNNLNKDFMIHPDQQLLIPVLYQQQQVQPQPFQRQNYELYF